MIQCHLDKDSHTEYTDQTEKAE